MKQPTNRPTNLTSKSYAVLLVSNISTVKELCKALKVSQPTFRKYVGKNDKVMGQLIKNKYRAL